MKLFRTDLFRNFAIGFAVGAAIVGAQVAPDMLDSAAPAAHAATLK